MIKTEIDLLAKEIIKDGNKLLDILKEQESKIREGESDGLITKKEVDDLMKSNQENKRYAKQAIKKAKGCVKNKKVVGGSASITLSE